PSAPCHHLVEWPYWLKPPSSRVASETRWLHAGYHAFVQQLMSLPAKILIVDDNPVVLFNVAHLLKAAGFEVREAVTGMEGLAKAASESPDLVLLDVLLPDLNGVELSRRIKSDPSTRNLFVVLLSSVETSP